MAQHRQCLLEPRYRFAVGRSLVRLHASLPQIPDSLLPQLALECMVAQSLDVLGEAVGIETFDHLYDPRVKRSPALIEQSAVRDLVSERVLEGILEVRIEAGLVEELGSLQVVEPATERLVRQLGDHREQYQP